MKKNVTWPQNELVRTGDAPQLRVQVLEHGEGLPMPRYETEGAAGMDLRAAVAIDAPMHMLPGEHILVPTGLCIQLPHGFEAQIRPRSGLAAKFAVTVLNSPGTIDWDYRGEIKVILINHGRNAFVIERGERIAQMIIAPVVQVDLVEVKQLDDTDRGDGGFGSTGQIN